MGEWSEPDDTGPDRRPQHTSAWALRKMWD
jgi:hypothetical protein